MKICVAQTKPVKGDVEANIINHKKLIDVAVSHGVNTIIFPELSITGYEPELANELATHQYDHRFDKFQQLCDAYDVTIGIGAPVKIDAGVCIGMVIFQPHKSRETYFKKYLHSSEEPFFVSNENTVRLVGYEANISIAICYELSVPAHAENAHEMGADIYIASIVESFNDIEKAHRNLKGIAMKYGMQVLMANCVGRSGNYDCAGRSAVWNDKGELLAALNDSDEGILIFDTETGAVTNSQQLVKEILY